MKTKFFTILITVLVTFQGIAQKDYLHESKVDKDKRMEWWKDGSLGMFIHWGLYSVPAGRYHGKVSKAECAEWFMNNKKIPIKKYETYADQLDTLKLDPKKWVSIAKKAVIKYIVITSK